jgi:hypothetical protein
MGASLATRVSQPGRLELIQNGNQAFHALNGARVNQSDVLELQLTGGRWLRGRYEWSGHLARWPAFRVQLGGPWESGPHEGPIPAAVLALHPEAVVRRPED